MAFVWYGNKTQVALGKEINWEPLSTKCLWEYPDVSRDNINIRMLTMHDEEIYILCYNVADIYVCSNYWRSSKCVLAFWLWKIPGTAHKLGEISDIIIVHGETYFKATHWARLRLRGDCCSYADGPWVSATCNSPIIWNHLWKICNWKDWR